jgi:hypothetical protein
MDARWYRQSKPTAGHRPDADPVKPWLDVGPLPNTPAGLLGFLLNNPVFAYRVLRPVERKAATDQPTSKIQTAGMTHSPGF